MRTRWWIQTVWLFTIVVGGSTALGAGILIWSTTDETFASDGIRALVTIIAAPAAALPYLIAAVVIELLGEIRNATLRQVLREDETDDDWAD